MALYTIMVEFCKWTPVLSFNICQNRVVMTKLHACKLQCNCAVGTPHCELHMLNKNTCCLHVVTCKHPMLTRCKHVCLCVNRECWHPIGQTIHWWVPMIGNNPDMVTQSWRSYRMQLAWFNRVWPVPCSSPATNACVLTCQHIQMRRQRHPHICIYIYIYLNIHV